MSEPFLRIYGSCDWCPMPRNDASTYLLDDKIIIDTGWKGVSNLIDDEIDPLQAKLMLFTHLHPDHRLALPQLLMYWRIRTGSLAGLTVAGPGERMQSLYDHAFDYLFHDEDDPAQIPAHANIMPVMPGDVIETQTHIIESAASHHNVPGRMYRITHKPSGRVIGFTGDTGYFDGIGEFFAGVDTLVCECTRGDERESVSGHMNLWEVAKAANAVQPQQLVLTHCTRDRDAILDEILPLVSCDAFWAEPGDLLLY